MHSMFSRRVVPLAATLAAFASLSLAACHKDSTSPDTPTAVSVVSGNNQITTAGVMAANPLVIEVVDQAGSPMSGIGVTWAIASGAGTLSATSSTTGSNGESQVTYTPDATTGTATVTATVGSLSPASFTITVNADSSSTGS